MIVMWKTLFFLNELGMSVLLEGSGEGVAPWARWQHLETLLTSGDVVGCHSWGVAAGL